MSKGAVIKGDFQPGAARYAIAMSRFNSFIVERLLDGALAALLEQGVDRERITIVQVPGAWELPVAVGSLARRRDIDAVIALGTVIRGETAHFDYVAGECVGGLSRIMLETGKPVTLGVLTVETLEQAEARSCPSDNKGAEAALAALEMVSLLARLKSESESQPG